MAATLDTSLPLTARELEILTMFRTGARSGAIADKLCVAKRTIDFHAQNIYRKLEVNNRLAAIMRAQELGLFKAA
jgi:LuxR family maltose regulon positive regulatory protein